MSTVKNIVLQARLIASSNWLQAMQILESAISEYPEEGRLYAELGSLYSQKDNAIKAAEYYGKALKYDKDNESYMFSLGTTYFQLKKYNKAIEVFEKIKSFFPEAMYNKALTYRALGENGKDVQILKMLADKRVKIDSVYVALLSDSLQNDNEEEFLQYLNIAKNLEIESANIVFLEGLHYMRKGNYLAAFHAFSKGGDECYQNERYCTAYFHAAIFIGNLDNALNIINKTLEVFKENPEALFNRAKLYLMLDNLDLAKKDIETIKKLGYKEHLKAANRELKLYMNKKANK
ncbi:MAG: tetratricopeptide repeat protein [Candidatus Cloacimonadales bacterium]|jgi:tetratricopeptide (TPR) repeat protein|nr:tetratricopeptide repeat protein [Candidatus Cloacimonadota bacterium]MDD2650720.1 tetratricopeptide repeat protein [Candidatus Cloacimonadota bacterium]MDD3501616.1 tetratricopeptide repeat protein [Candidatus Cloacimonadota bacterium]MDX9978177.1 tetratricopeptide repeat protein [Candidatus Cloacimonadales bacterium]